MELSVHCFCHFNLFVNINDLHNIGLDNLRNEAFFFHSSLQQGEVHKQIFIEYSLNFQQQFNG